MLDSHSSRNPSSCNSRDSPENTTTNNHRTTTNSILSQHFVFKRSLNTIILTNSSTQLKMSSGRQLRSQNQKNQQSGKCLPTNQQSRKDLPTTQALVLHTKKELETGNTPNYLCCALKGLTSAQKSDIRDMGFESIISFSIQNIPIGLGYWLLVNYDHERNELNVGSHMIKITPSKVHDVFGVPMGRIPVSENKRARKKDVIREEWRNQFFQSHVTVKDVLGKLKSCRKGGILFKVNFLVLFNSIMGEMTKSGDVNKRFLSSITNEGDISNMDWCSYIITCLKRTKEEWNVTEPYNGPLTFLAVLYAHELQLKCSPENAITPAIQYVTTDYLVDLESSMFGKGLRSNDNVEAQVQSAHEGQAQTVEVQTAIDQNVNVSQDEEDELRYNSANPNVTSIPTVDDTVNFKERRINRCNQLESLRDENLLAGGDDELLEPKQEFELDENASHMTDSLAKSSSCQRGMVRVKGYKVNRLIAPILIDIFRKHGDIAAACVLKSDHVKSTILESVCELFKRIQTDDVEKMSEAVSLVTDAKAVNIDVSWLEALVEAVCKRKEANKEYCLCLETKAGVVMAKRPAQMDLGDRRAELVAAQERFKDAERCVTVLHLVEKKLNSQLLEYEADPVVNAN